MKYSELERELRKAGCSVQRPGKRHDIWYSPITGKQFAFPRHKTQDVPMGTLKSIKQDAGLK